MIRPKLCSERSKQLDDHFIDIIEQEASSIVFVIERALDSIAVGGVAVHPEIDSVYFNRAERIAKIAIKGILKNDVINRIVELYALAGWRIESRKFESQRDGDTTRFDLKLQDKRFEQEVV